MVNRVNSSIRRPFRLHRWTPVNRRSAMAFGLLRFSLCGKLAVRCGRGHVVGYVPPGHCSRFNVTTVVRWTSTGTAPAGPPAKPAAVLPSRSNVLRLYRLAKPEKDRLLGKSRPDDRVPRGIALIPRTVARFQAPCVCCWCPARSPW